MINKDASIDELLALLKARQEEAFPLLYARCMPDFCVYGKSQGLSFEDAEESSHDSLLQIAKCIDTFDEHRDRGEGWIWTIHRNKVIDRLRKRGSVGFEELTEAYPGSDKDSPERYVENNLRLQALARATARLPEWARRELRPNRGPGRRSQTWHKAGRLLRALLAEEEER